MIAQDGRLEAHRAGGRITIAVDIYADLLCPYSYIIKFILEDLQKRYEKAHAAVNIELLWRPHCVIPPLERRVDKLQMYQHFERIYPNMLARIQERGAKHGASFALTGFTGSSRAAHRLIRLTLRAAGPARQADVVGALYHGHFVGGLDISDDKWLLHVGLAAGMSRKLVKSALRDKSVLDGADSDSDSDAGSDDSLPTELDGNDRGGESGEEEEDDDDDDDDDEYEYEDDELEEEEEEEEELIEEEGEDDTQDAFERDVPDGIKGEPVPCIIIQGRYKVGGLQNAEVYEGVFEKLRIAAGL